MRGSLVLAATVANVIAACVSPIVAEYVPETVGIVTSRELVGRDLHFELADGAEFVSPANMDYFGGSQPAADDLLLAGTRPDLWVYRATPEAEAAPDRPLCYALFGETRIRGSQVLKTVGDPTRGKIVLVFPIAPDWRDVGRSGDLLHGAKTCINEDGEAFEQRPASAEG